MLVDYLADNGTAEIGSTNVGSYRSKKTKISSFKEETKALYLKENKTKLVSSERIFFSNHLYHITNYNTVKELGSKVSRQFD